MKLPKPIKPNDWKSIQIKTFENGHVCLTVKYQNQIEELVRLNGAVLFLSVEKLFVSLRKSMHEYDNKKHSSVSGFRLEPFGMLSLSKHTSHKPVDSVNELILLHAEYLI